MRGERKENPEKQVHSIHTLLAGFLPLFLFDVLIMLTSIKQDSPDSQDLLVCLATRVGKETKEARVTKVFKESPDRRANLDFLD